MAQEVIYQRALAIEMEKQGLGFAREMEMPIFYEGFDIGTRRVDFFVEEKIMVELKQFPYWMVYSCPGNELFRSI